MPFLPCEKNNINLWYLELLPVDGKGSTYLGHSTCCSQVQR